MTSGLGNRVCHCCNRGIPQRAQRTIIRNAIVNGNLERVSRWTCSCCQTDLGKTIEIFTYGKSITAESYAARYAVLAAL